MSTRSWQSIWTFKKLISLQSTYGNIYLSDTVKSIPSSPNLRILHPIHSSIQSSILISATLFLIQVVYVLVTKDDRLQYFHFPCTFKEYKHVYFTLFYRVVKSQKVLSRHFR